MTSRTIAGSILAAAIALGVGSAMAAPPFWGVTYAWVNGPDNPAGLGGGRPVHVAALLPPPLSCSTLIGARLNDPPPYPRVRDMLRAAPVIVTIDKGACPPPGENRWLRFSVAHPFDTDIIQLIYVTPSGKTLGTEKVSIAGGTGGRPD